MDNTILQKRSKELVSKMTLTEKVMQLKYNASPVERLGIPEYNWWNEALHGVARAGTATVFPQAIALAAIFDDDFLYEIADIISTEVRAKYNECVRKNDRDTYKGLTCWSPNINIFRDPRWGRGHETYGEDPYLTARLGAAFIRGLQGDGKYLKAAACAKHFVVHSGPEAIRHEFNAIVSAKDMADTYLPAFETCVTQAKVEAVMGAYNRTNGEPCCGSKTLLVDLLRTQWGFEGHVVSDCWAVRDFHTTHKITVTAPESAAYALKNGCDLNCGNMYVHLLNAVDEGLCEEKDIDRSVERLMVTRMKLGLFADDCEYDSIPYEMNDCKEHQEKNLEAARKCMVLLKNDGLLPLNKNKLSSIAVIGPNADSREMLRGNYYGTASNSVTILQGVRNYVGDEVRIYYSEGCHLFEDRIEQHAKKDDRILEAVSAAERSDVVILCLGLDATIEGEETDTKFSKLAGDRADLYLPGRQHKLMEAIVETGKPVVLIMGTGSALDLNWADKHCNAVLNAWYPGSLGGQAAAELIFGDHSPGGKLPITFYKDVDSLPAFTDYSMEGRTYRYLRTDCIYPFGYGLTYSSVVLSDLEIIQDGIAKEGVDICVTIKNTGSFPIEEVMQCYIKNMDSQYELTNHRLCAFKRVSLCVKETKTVVLRIPQKAFMVSNSKGEYIHDGNRFLIAVGISQPDQRSIALLKQKPLTLEYRITEKEVAH